MIELLGEYWLFLNFYLIDLVRNTTGLREDEYSFPIIHEKIPIKSLELEDLRHAINSYLATLNSKNEYQKLIIYHFKFRL